MFSDDWLILTEFRILYEFFSMPKKIMFLMLNLNIQIVNLLTLKIVTKK